MNTGINKYSKRNLSLDLIRILAIFLVLYTHTSAAIHRYYTLPSSEGILSFLNLAANCFRTINNHLLFMISGALLLGKQEPLKVLWKKRILRFVITLVIFSYVQALWSAYQADNLDIFSVFSAFTGMLEKPVRAQYWYLYSYISFLVMLPFLSMIARGLDDRNTAYLLVISIIVLDVFPILAFFLKISRINFSIFITPFTTLSPLLGYYLVHFRGGFLRKFRSSLLMLIIGVGLIIACLMEIKNHSVINEWSDKFITLFYTSTAVCVFELVQRASAKINSIPEGGY